MRPSHRAPIIPHCYSVLSPAALWPSPRVDARLIAQRSDSAFKHHCGSRQQAPRITIIFTSLRLQFLRCPCRSQSRTPTVHPGAMAGLPCTCHGADGYRSTAARWWSSRFLTGLTEDTTSVVTDLQGLSKTTPMELLACQANTSTLT